MAVSKTGSMLPVVAVRAKVACHNRASVLNPDGCGTCPVQVCGPVIKVLWYKTLSLAALALIPDHYSTTATP